MKRNLAFHSPLQVSPTADGRSRQSFRERLQRWLVALTVTALGLLADRSQAAVTICELDPPSLPKDPNCALNAPYQLQIRGIGFTSPAANYHVYWNGSYLGTGQTLSPASACPGSPSNTIGSILTVSLPCAKLDTVYEFETFPVFVRDTSGSGADSNPLSFTVLNPLSTSLLDTTDVPVGTTGYTQTISGSTGQGGVVASFVNPAGSVAAVMTTANYTPGSLPAGLTFIPGDPNNSPSQLFDVRIVDLSGNPVGSSSAVLALEFYYPTSYNPFESHPTFQLQFEKPGFGWTAVTGAMGSGFGSSPFYVDKDTSDNLSGSCCLSGGRFSVVLDNLGSASGGSDPSIADLSGTVFALAPSMLVAAPSLLWPPNHKMIQTTVNAPGYSILSVSSNEPDTGAPDWIITGPLTVNLRAERDAQGKGRIYTLLLQRDDGSQNIAVVQVPHDRGGKTKP